MSADKYKTDADMAELFGVSEETAIQWRRHYGWPCLKVGRQIRYTDADVRAIEQMHHVVTRREAGLSDQTALSAARSA